jgi:hypothetical protein
MASYRITVVTGNRDGAGTDADVFIVLNGANGSTPEVSLDNAENNFERCAVDVFWVNLPDVGALSSINIRHNNRHEWGTPGGPGWFLSSVFVRNEDTNTEWAFPNRDPCHGIGRWLARDEDDKQLSRLLPVDDSILPAPPKIVFFEAEPDYINAGGSSTLSWQVVNCEPASQCMITLEGHSGWAPYMNLNAQPVDAVSFRSVIPQLTTEYRLSVMGTGSSNAPAGPEHKEVTVSLAPAMPAGQWYPFCFKLVAKDGSCFTVVSYAADLATATALAQANDTNSTVTALPNCDFLDAACNLGTNSSAILLRERIAQLIGAEFVRNERIKKFISRRDADDLAEIIKKKVMTYVPPPKPKGRPQPEAFVNVRNIRVKAKKKKKS